MMAFAHSSHSVRPGTCGRFAASGLPRGCGWPWAAPSWRPGACPGVQWAAVIFLQDQLCRVAPNDPVRWGAVASKRTIAMRAASIEPTIAEMLDDPIVGLLMAHDGVTVEELWRLLEDARRRLKGGKSPSMASGLAAQPLVEVMAIA